MGSGGAGQARGLTGVAARARGAYAEGGHRSQHDDQQKRKSGAPTPAGLIDGPVMLRDGRDFEHSHVSPSLRPTRASLRTSCDRKRKTSSMFRLRALPDETRSVPSAPTRAPGCDATNFQLATLILTILAR